MIVRDFQRVIGDEILAQIAEKGLGRVDAVVACVGGGSNAIGTFFPFVATHDRRAPPAPRGRRGGRVWASTPTRPARR